MNTIAHLRQRRARPIGAASAGRMRGGTFIGFLAGLILGLAAAAVVTLFVTQGSAPFVNRAGRAPDRSLEPKTPPEAPDPNAPMQSRNRPTPSAQAPASDDSPKPDEEIGGGILERLFGRRADPDAKRPDETPQAPRSGPGRSAEQASGAEPQSERATYLLQAGAFRSQEDADAMRARLALVGFEARVVSGEVGGQPIHRVRVGPFGSLDDMNKARARLAENGIEATAVRQK